MILTGIKQYLHDHDRGAHACNHEQKLISRMADVMTAEPWCRMAWLNIVHSIYHGNPVAMKTASSLWDSFEFDRLSDLGNKWDSNHSAEAN